MSLLRTNLEPEKLYAGEGGRNEDWKELDFEPSTYPSPRELECSELSIWPDIEHELYSMPSYDYIPQVIMPIQPPALQQSAPHFSPSHSTWSSTEARPTISPVQLNTTPTSSGHTTKENRGKPRGTSSIPRKILTDDDRRRMCLYHENNPAKKQTEIGALFGVERSTVSKILRQRDKYLSPKGRSSSPVKRTKGKFPDIERALSIWARKFQDKNVCELTDVMIRDQAEVFARAAAVTTVATAGYKESFDIKINSNSWLEKFKQRNEIITQDSGAQCNIPEFGPKPTSPPSRLNSGSTTPIAREIETDAKFEKHVSFTEMDSQTNSTSLNRPASKSSSNSFAFSTDSSMASTAQLPSLPYLSPQTKLLHSTNQTFLKSETNSTYNSSPQDMIKSELISVGSSSKTESTPRIALPLQSTDTVFSYPPLKHSESPISLPPSNTLATFGHKSQSGLPVASLPSLDDAEKALEILLRFFSHTPNHYLIDQNEFLTVLRLTNKMRITHGRQ